MSAHAFPLVVLVDENPATLVDLTRALLLLDVSLAWFTSTADALAIFSREAPAVLVCGPDVPPQDADDFLGVVAARSPRTQRLLLCSNLARPLRSGPAVMRWPNNPLHFRAFIADATLFAATAAY